MLHINPHRHSNLINSQDSIKRKMFRRFTVLAAGMIVILASLGIFSGSQAAGNASAIQEAKSNGPKQESRVLPDLNSPDAKNQMSEFYAQDLYLMGHVGADNPATISLMSTQAIQTMFKLLEQGVPEEHRNAAIHGLVQAPPAVVPPLLEALGDSDSSVRQGAAEILGARRAPEAENSLFFATFDSDPGVRAASAKALGDFGAMYALPRLQWLQVTETDSDVQLAARLAEKRVYAIVAATLGIQPGDLRVIAIAPSNGRVYAAAKGELYSPDGLDWRRVGILPGVPTALAATGKDGQILYLGTASSGIFRSVDGGRTWQAANWKLPAANSFAVTALTVSPENDRQVYIALADQAGTTPLMPFGLFASSDAGGSWVPLTPWNVDDITSRLVIDSSEPPRLLGLTDGAFWRYSLANGIGHEP